MKSIIILFLGLACNLANASPQAANSYTYSSGGIAAHGRFSSDASTGLAVIDQVNDTIVIFLKNPAGALIPSQKIKAGKHLSAIVAADLNRDKFDDLLVTSQGTNEVLYFQNDGYGKFSQAGAFRTKKGPNAISVGDFDHDNLVDFAVISSSDNALEIFFNDVIKPGKILRQAAYRIGSGSSAGRSIAIADFDQDGLDDVAVTNTGDGTVGVLMNTAANPGTLQPQVTYTVGGLSTTTGAIAVGDFNNDGYPDLINLNSQESTVSLLKNNGDGTFASQARYAVADGNSVGGIIAADLNGDHYLDVMVTNPGESSVSVLKGQPGGTFATHTEYSTVATPLSLFLTDANSDGNMDVLVIADPSNMTLLMNDGSGNF